MSGHSHDDKSDEGSSIDALESAINSHREGDLGEWELQLVKRRIEREIREAAIYKGTAIGLEQRLIALSHVRPTTDLYEAAKEVHDYLWANIEAGVLDIATASPLAGEGLSARLTALKSALEIGQHKWDRDGERCVKCGAKDWMGGPCSTPSATRPSEQEISALIDKHTDKDGFANTDDMEQFASELLRTTDGGAE